MEKELPPFPNQGFWSRPDHSKIIDEGQPGPMLESHPALLKSKFRPILKADIDDFYRLLSGGQEPPTLAEVVARFRAEGKPLPPHFQKILDEADDAD